MEQVEEEGSLVVRGEFSSPMQPARNYQKLYNQDDSIDDDELLLPWSPLHHPRLACDDILSIESPRLIKEPFDDLNDFYDNGLLTQAD
jgi:hypothetical protein